MKYSVIVSAFFLSCITKNAFSESKTAEVYNGMRNLAMTVSAKEMGVPEDSRILSIMMESADEDGVMTLIATADGSCSVYFSTGGGVLGAGEHESAHKAALNFIKSAEEFLPKLKPTKSAALPKIGNTIFYVHTPKEILSAEFKEDDLGEGKVELSPLFFVGQDLVGEIRAVSDAAQNKNTKTKKGK